MGVFKQVASNIKGFARKFACASYVNGAQALFLLFFCTRLDPEGLIVAQMSLNGAASQTQNQLLFSNDPIQLQTEGVVLSKSLG